MSFYICELFLLDIFVTLQRSKKILSIPEHLASVIAPSLLIGLCPGFYLFVLLDQGGSNIFKPQI